MYNIYHTEGIVFRGTGTGEGSKMLSVLTKNFGLLHARAQGVREGRSKLRYSLQSFSYTHLDMVRGKNGWRITSALERENLTGIPAEKRKSALRIIRRAADFLERFLPVEAKDEALFLTVLHSLRALKKETLSHKALRDFEALFIMNLLHHLGYWGEDEMLATFISVPPCAEPGTLAAFAPFRTRAVRRINATLREI